jgi:uncharacterized membrane protein
MSHHTQPEKVIFSNYARITGISKSVSGEFIYMAILPLKELFQ